MLATMPKETVSKVTRVSRKAAGGAVAAKTASTSSSMASSAVAGSKAAVAPPTAEMVAARAYAIYLEEGRPKSRQLEHWIRAEAELLRN